MKNYSIGLDIGTASVGWAVMSDDLKLIRKKMKVKGNTNTKHLKKNFWGVRLFDGGETAEDRRLKRTTRRRYTRRRQRIVYLQNMFREEVEKVDANFFFRLDESFYVPEDKKHSKYPIFGTLEEEKDYYKQFPTIYHLRKHLADTDESADIRLVYLALAHIIKFRGNFLKEGELNSENTSISKAFSEFLTLYNETFLVIEDNYLSVDGNQLEEALKAKVSRTKRFERALTLAKGEKRNGLLAQFIKLIVGNMGNFKTVFSLEEDCKMQFSKDTFEEDFEQLLILTSEDYREIFLAAKNVYDAVELSGILSESDIPTQAKLSNQMTIFYQEHHDDLMKLKRLVKAKLPKVYFEMFNDESKNGYAGYINGEVSQADFYKYVEKSLKKVEGSEYFIEKMNQEVFLRKQRSFYNGVIPHQIHLAELRAIIQMQKKYHPFLAEIGAKIEALFKFKIPYYVGPLARGNSDFAWLVRKSDEKITPWNLDEVINREDSAIKFIERMTNFDTYLPDEKVLPSHSMLYQKYIVFNELTKVTYDDDRGMTHNFSSQEKLEIFEDLFMQQSKVTVKHLIDYLRLNYHIESATIKGVDEKFNASYSTYHDLKKIAGMETLLNDPAHDAMIEDIIKIMTVFEDRKMRRTQISQYKGILNDEQIKQLARKHYTGWGRFSEKLLNGIRDQHTKKTILDYLISDNGTKRNINRNFMQLINDDQLSFKAIIQEAQTIEDDDNLAALVADLTGSPAIKKGILQSLYIVNEIVEIMGYKPSHIVVEMARENQTSRRSVPRYARLEKAILELGSNILKEEPTNNQAIQKERLYLYYLQNGKDMYKDQELDINNLSNYDIDHIIPQSFTTDNSINNKVLTSSSDNRGDKADKLPSKAVIKQRKAFWRSLHKAGLMSDAKFNNLTKAERGGFTEDEKARFIKRQLVETRQITKNVANILDNHFNQERDDLGNIVRTVQIVTLKSNLTTQFRNEFNIRKVRSINDYHHAHDAYLNAVIANKLLKEYPNLAPEFVYGEYPYYDSVKENKATARKQRMTNLMRFFAKEDRDTATLDVGKWHLDRDIQVIRNTLGSKQMNIVKKVEVQTGGFSKESILPKGESDKLIARKRNWSPEKYGGFNSPVVAYAVGITHLTGKNRKLAKALFGVNIMEQAFFEADPVVYLEEKGFVEPKVIMKLPKYSLYEFEDGRRRMVASAAEAQKGNQMVLPNHLVELLFHADRYDPINSPKSYEFVNDNVEKFAEILTEVNLFAEKYTLATGNLETINRLYAEHQPENIEEIAKSFVELMKFNAPGAPSDFNFFGTKIPRRRYTTLSEIWDAVIIHQSVTGLYETRTRFEVK